MQGGNTQIRQLPLAMVWQMLLDTLSLVPVAAEFTAIQFFNGWFADRYPEHHSGWGPYLPMLEVLARPGGPLERIKRQPEKKTSQWIYSFRTEHPAPDEWNDCTVTRCPYRQFMKKMGWEK